MKRKHTYISCLSALALGLPLSLLTSCTTDDLGGSSLDSRTVTLSVTLTKDGDSATRSYLEEQGGDLACFWQASDKIVVTTLGGEKVGVLNLPADFSPAQTATFSNQLEISGDPSQLNFIYYGNKVNAEEVPDTYSHKFSSQTGTLASLSDFDFFSNTVNVTVSGDQAVAEATTLERHTAFGRFRFTLDNNPLNTPGLAVTVNGSNLATTASINYKRKVTFSGKDTPIATNTDNAGEVWLTILPSADEDGNTTTTLDFEVTVGSKTYEGHLDDTHSWEAGQYVRNLNSETYYYEGVEVALSEKTAENPGGEYGEDDPDYPDYAGEDTRNPLHKFAKYNLTRTGDETNEFATIGDNGALYQWGRNHGFIDSEGPYEGIDNEYGITNDWGIDHDFSNFLDAMGGHFDYESTDNKWGIADYYVYCTDIINGLYRNTTLTTGTGMHHVSQDYFDVPKYYNSEETLKSNITKYFMDGTPGRSLGQNYGTYYISVSALNNNADYWHSTFSDGGNSWSSRAIKTGYAKSNPCPDGWRIPTLEEMKEIAPEGDGIDVTDTKNGLTGKYSNNAYLSTLLNDYSELRETEEGIRYVIRWIYTQTAIKIEAVVIDDPDFKKEDITSLFWDKNINNKVVREFPFTGVIKPFIAISQSASGAVWTTYICRPYHFGVPTINFMPACGYPHVPNYTRIDPADEGNFNRAIGAYWVEEKGYAFKFTTRDIANDLSYAILKVESAEPVMGYAIRPVMDKKTEE